MCILVSITFRVLFSCIVKDVGWFILSFVFCVDYGGCLDFWEGLARFFVIGYCFYCMFSSEVFIFYFYCGFCR